MLISYVKNADICKFLYRLKKIFHIPLLLLVLAILATSGRLHAQWSLDIVGNMKNLTEKSKLDGATITVLRNGKPYQNISSASGGKFKLKLDPEGDYEIVFSKPGFVSKRVTASTKGIPPEDAKYGFEFPMEVSLFEEIPGLDVSILKQPIGKLAFNPSTGYIDYDQKYTESIQKELDRLMKEFEERMKAMEAERKKKEAEYKAAVDAGNKAFSSKNYEEAKAQFNKAAGIKPNEDYPPKKIAEIESILAGNADKDKKYLDAIAKGDKAFGEEKYTDAIAAYKEAIAAKPSEKYPQNKLSEIDNLLANAQKIEKEYNDAIAKADQLFGLKDYANAKTNYQKASQLKPNQEYPKKKISEIDALIAEQQGKEKAYADAIAAADKAFGNESYEEAITQYEKASQLKKEEKYPKDKIAEAKNLLAKNAQLEADYKAAISKADNLFAAKNYPESKKEYVRATSLKPKETYPKNQITEIDKLMAEEASREANYKDAIAKADMAFKTDNLEQAKEQYTKALQYKPAEKYPQDQLTLIDKKLSEQNQKDKAYNEFIAKADADMAGEKYTDAKNLYNKALEIKPAEKYPKDKIKELEKLMADQAMKEEERKKNDAKYAEFIKQADARLATKEYDISLLRYKDAAAIKPAEEYPKKKIQEIEELLAKLAKEQEEIKLKQASDKKKKEQYEEYILSADKSFKLEKYEEAKSSYEKALTILPDEKYPKDRIAQIDEILKKKQSEAQLAAEAEKKKREYYDALIAKADNDLAAEEFTKARENYQMALAVMPSEQYPKNKLAEIEQLIKLKQQKQLDAQKLAELEKQKEEQYKSFLSKAEKSVAVKEYQEAINFLQSAAALKPTESFPPKRIQEIQQLLAEIKLTQDKNKQLDLDYLEFVEQADNLFKNKQYKDARDKYQSAAKLKEKEIYPVQRMKEIDRILEDLALNEKKNKEQEEANRKRKEQFDAITKEADQFFAEQKYDESRKKFNEALGLIPQEPYALGRLKDIDAALEELRRKQENEQQQAEREKKYKEFIERGDRGIVLNSYQNAKDNFEKALGLKPEEEYPKNKIAEINELLANQNKQVVVSNNTNRATISDEKEKQLDKLFEDLRNKNYDAKKKWLEQTTQELNETNEYRISQSAQKRKENQEELSETEKRIRDYHDIRSRDHLANVEVVYKNQEELQQQEDKYKADSYRKRQEALKDMNQLDYEIKIKQQAQNQWHKDNYEAMKNYEQELAAEHLRKINQNNQKRNAEYERQQNQYEEILLNAKEGNKRREENTKQFYREQQEIAEEQNTWIALSNQRRKNSEETLLELTQSLKEIEEKKSQMHKANFENLKKEQENLYEQEMFLKTSSEEKRQINYENNITLYNTIVSDNEKRKERNKVNIDLLARDMEELAETEKVRQAGSLAKRTSNAEEIQATQIIILKQQELGNTYHKNNFENLKRYEEAVAQNEAERIDFSQKNREQAYKEQLNQAAELERIYTAKEENYMKNNVSMLEKTKQQQAQIENERRNAEQYKRDKISREIAELAEQIQQVHEQKNKSYLAKANEIKKIQFDNEDFHKNLMAASSEKIINHKPVYYVGEAKPAQSDLKGKYPEGVSEETVEDGNAIILRRTVVRGEKIDVYQKIYYKWGGIFFTKNGYNVTEALWNTETR